MTKDMSKLYKARQEIKLSRICFRAAKGAVRDGRGRIDADLDVPISSCAFVGTCSVSTVFATSRGPLQSTRACHVAKRLHFSQKQDLCGNWMPPFIKPRDSSPHSCPVEHSLAIVLCGLIDRDHCLPTSCNEQATYFRWKRLISSFKLL